MSPLLFLARPERWLRTIHTERGTCSAAPNFAYDLCSTKIDDEALEGISLDSWRAALNGAECVHAATIERFCTRFAPYGFRREAMMPVYGLAECSLGLTFTPPERGPLVDRVRRGDFHARGRAVPAGADDPDALTFVSCGQSLPGHEVRIVDDSGREVGDRRTGRLQFRGPSATSGYYRNPQATRALVRGDWLDSGDHAYVSGGEVYPVGRVRDLIIKAGRNIHPKDLEEIVGRIPGVRAGGVAVFGSPDPTSGTERLVVMAETREEEPGAREEMTRSIREAVTDFLDAPPDDIVLVPPRTVPKTPSGKIQRFSCREIYERGDAQRGGRSVAVQFVRLALASVVPQVRSLGRRLAERIYSAYAWSVSAAAGLGVWMAVMMLPSREARRRAVRTGCRFLMRAAGLRLTVTGIEALPAGSARLVVPNHASYLDTVVMAAALPPRFEFVAKRELSDSVLFRTFYRRLGTRFVERFDPAAGSEELAGLEAAVRGGASLVLFPEGTLTRAPGLRPFRMGAFLLACRTGVGLVPVGIEGTRSILRDGDWSPRRGAVRVTIGAPLFADGDDWSAAVRLRDRVRAEILASCGEVDLTEI